MEKASFHWNEYPSETPYECSSYHILDNIQDVGNDILEKVRIGTETRRAYKLIPMELSFYKQIGLPIPSTSPTFRHE